MHVFAEGMVFDLNSAIVRERVATAIQNTGPRRRAGGPFVPVAFVTGCDVLQHDNLGLPTIQTWSGGREPGKENPFSDETIRHIIGASPTAKEKDLLSTVEHLRTGCPIRLADVITTPERIHRFDVSDPTHRDTKPAELGELLSLAALQPRLVQDLTTLAEELIKNALYDAPTHEGKAVYRGVSRKLPVPVVKPIDVEVALAYGQCAICVRDHFGSLSAQQILQNLKRCYTSGDAQIDTKRGGAGLGLFMALTGSTRLVFNIWPERQTEVILLRDCTLRPRQFGASAPTLNICEIAGPQGL